MGKEVSARDQSKERQEAKNPIHDSYKACLDFSFPQFLYKKDTKLCSHLCLCIYRCRLVDIPFASSRNIF